MQNNFRRKPFSSRKINRKRFLKTHEIFGFLTLNYRWSNFIVGCPFPPISLLYRKFFYRKFWKNNSRFRFTMLDYLCSNFTVCNSLKKVVLNSDWSVLVHVPSLKSIFKKFHSDWSFWPHPFSLKSKFSKKSFFHSQNPFPGIQITKIEFLRKMFFLTFDPGSTPSPRPSSDDRSR